MAFCAGCGSEIEAGSAFCGSCGAAAPPPESAAPTVMTSTPPPAPPSTPPPVPPAAPVGPAPVPPPATGPPSYGPPAAPAPGAGYSQPSGGGGAGKVVLIALLALLGVGIIVVLLLGFAVGPKWFTSGGNDKADAEKVVQEFYNAMQKGDAQAMIKLLDAGSIKELDDAADELGYDDGEEFLQEYLDYAFPEGDLKITGLKYETTVKGDKATVEVVGGKATYTDYYGDEVTENYDDEGEVFSDEAFELKKTGGKWYLVPEFNL